MSSSFSIVREDQFIQATRDSGYKGTASALSELIDNSLQAKASRVSIRMVPEEPAEQLSAGRPRQPRVIEVAIADNGRGMTPEQLRRALRFGDGSRFGDRTDLGRFGMGLPNASVSQCERFEVFSWQKGRAPLFTYVDVDEVANGKMSEIPDPWAEPVPEQYRDLVTGPSGTLVIWKRCDRLDQDAKIEALVRSLRHTLGRIFRYFLIADFQLSINDTSISAFDPLFLLPEARLDGEPLGTAHGDKVELEVPILDTDHTSQVVISFSLLPEQWQASFRTDQKERNKRFIDTTSGFSIVRHGREIDLIKSPYHAKHWTDAWYRVEIRFEPELDEVFGVTHTKQHARIPKDSPIYERLKPVIVNNVNTMKAMIVARGKKAHKSRADRAEEAARKVAPRLQPIDELQGKPATQVNAEIRSFVDNQRIAKGLHAAEAEHLRKRLTDYEMLIELEALPGAPFYRTKVVGRSIVVLLNTDHLFYERIFRRLETESPAAKTGVELMLMTLARAELLCSDEVRDWYEDQRHEWSRHLKVFLTQLEEVDPSEGPESENGRGVSTKLDLA